MKKAARKNIFSVLVKLCKIPRYSKKGPLAIQHLLLPIGSRILRLRIARSVDVRSTESTTPYSELCKIVSTYSELLRSYEVIVRIIGNRNSPLLSVKIFPRVVSIACIWRTTFLPINDRILFSLFGPNGLIQSFQKYVILFPPFNYRYDYDDPNPV
jgi:hypothetical protein